MQALARARKVVTELTMATSRDFATMLDELIAADDALRSAGGHIEGVDFLNAMEALHSGRITITDDAAEALYGEIAAELPPADPRPSETVARPLPSLDPVAIERELGIRRARTGAELDALRRRFAFANHPDRVPPELRDRAEQRMRIANALVDEAKRSA